ncbi:MAG: ACT domain-containing protein [Actinomycetes bacterium]
MPVVAVRVWLPDRPGALGAVASRIGAVGGDVIGIDIIDRGAGRAVDELVVELPEDGLTDLLLREVADVEGVDVEDVRELDGPPPDPSVVALSLARSLRDAGTDRMPLLLAEGARQLLAADWAAVVPLDGAAPLAAAGPDVPADAWLAALVAGATAGSGSTGLDAVAVVRLDRVAAALVVSRERLPLRGREQRVLEELAGLA